MRSPRGFPFDLEWAVFSGAVEVATGIFNGSFRSIGGVVQVSIQGQLLLVLLNDFLALRLGVRVHH